MHKKIFTRVAVGFIFGLGLASCASQESHRSLASDGAFRSVNSGGERSEDKIECRLGEARNEDGDCERAHEFDHPFRRSGR